MGEGGYYWGLQFSISKSSPGAAVLVPKAEGSTARHHSIPSLRIHPLRIFKFYFQIHSDLYPNVGVVLKVLATGNNQVLSCEFPEHSPNALKPSRGLQHLPQSSFLTSVSMGCKHETIRYK